MNRLMRFFRGSAYVTIRGVDPQRCLNRFAGQGIPFYELTQKDEYCIGCVVLLCDAELAGEIARRCMCELTVEKVMGFRRQFYGLAKRPVLLAGIVLAAIAMSVLPQFIWTIEVEGNETVPAQQIVQELDQIGIHFGTRIRSIDNQMVKYRMMLRIPELQWLSVNCSGGRATVLVTERSTAAEPVDKRTVTNLVAARDGVIVGMSVLNGFPVCTLGQAVKKGDLLVSGYADWEVVTQATRAIAEIYALTEHRLEVKMPAQVVKKAPSGTTRHCIYLNFGRKRIKIFGNSGISVHDCDKIESKNFLTLPGGYQFPIGITVETCRTYEPKPDFLPEAQARELLQQGCGRQVKQSMVAGQIMQQREQFQAASGNYVLTAQIWAREMIARTEPAPIFTDEEEDDGTDHQRRTDGADH